MLYKKPDIDPLKWIDEVLDRPLDSNEPEVSWKELHTLRRAIIQDLDNWFNQRDELLDQIGIYQDALIKNGIPLPPVRGV